MYVVENDMYRCMMNELQDGNKFERNVKLKYGTIIF